MKTILIAGGFILFYSVTANAKSVSGTGRDKKEARHALRLSGKSLKKNEPAVSYQSNEAFLRDFPDAKDISWKVSALFEEATFNNNGTTMTAYYDPESDLVGTTVKKSFADIPQKARDYIRKFYSRYTPGEVILFDDNENNDTDMQLFGSPFEDGDNYFVPVTNDKETIVLKVNRAGDVSYFKKL